MDGWKWKLCLTLCNTMDCIPQARILEWVAFPFSRESSQPRDWTQVSRIAGRFFPSWATREVQEYWSGEPIPSPGDLPEPGIQLGCHALQVDSLSTELLGKPILQNKDEMKLLSGRENRRDKSKIIKTEKVSHGVLNNTFSSLIFIEPLYKNMIL